MVDEGVMVDEAMIKVMEINVSGLMTLNQCVEIKESE